MPIGGQDRVPSRVRLFKFLVSIDMIDEKNSRIRQDWSSTLPNGKDSTFIVRCDTHFICVPWRYLVYNSLWIWFCFDLLVFQAMPLSVFASLSKAHIHC